MTPEQFAYWLQGFAEMQLSKEPPTREQWETIKDHLQTVFKKVTPPLTNPYPFQPQIQPTNPLSPYQAVPGQFPPTTIC